MGPLSMPVTAPRLFPPLPALACGIVLSLGATADTPKDPPHNNYNLTWGAWQQRGDWYTGAFDDTAYFKRALTKDEILAFHDAMVAKP